jgi:hypothetical protein
MKKFILSLYLFLIVFLVCDPQTGVTLYKLTGPAWVPAIVIAQPDGSIKMDLSKSDIGVNQITVAACYSDTLWGCSEAVPFSFTRPAPPVTIKNIRLSQ